MNNNVIPSHPDIGLNAAAQPLTRSASGRHPKVFIKTFGCQMNTRDSEVMAGLLQKEGFELVDEPALADVALVNTCSVRKHAEDRAYGTIWELKKIKKKNPALLIGVLGCMAEKEKENIFRQAPHVNIIAGPHSFYRLPEMIKSLKDNSGKVMATDTGGEPFISESIARRVNPYQAWISVIRGCNNFCSFCIVPYVRGREKSRPQEEILETVKALAKEGVKEVTLLGQNVLSYGKDLKDTDFVNLLEEINEISAIERLRFITAHPKDVNLKFIDAQAHLSKVCEHLHLPLQSGSDRMLKMMNRGYTRNNYLEIIQNVRKIMPEAGITSDIIVGFPGETEEDFLKTKELLKEVQFDNAFIFKYSPREGTRAGKSEDSVPKEIKEKRLAELLEIQEKIAFKRNKTLEGRGLEVSVEKTGLKDKTKVVGRTRTNKIVVFPAGGDMVGKTVNVLIEEAGSWRLLGRQID
ncbi:MAG: tRNA (N6-isopentenyl adenosine(37)-C2)-methylthiotransferase MiaB [Candidatus Ratteibacteria bacterium]|nr:tRNA (N6-isopentenyl adenosine(37)-C2)-methylthiotransferase MiaB [Candidatus Ratteibacteria bacterium]